jgi:hypothetical protein
LLGTKLENKLSVNDKNEDELKTFFAIAKQILVGLNMAVQGEKITKFDSNGNSTKHIDMAIRVLNAGRSSIAG